MELAPECEIILSQRGSLRRLIVAYFSRTRMIVRLATVIVQGADREVVQAIKTTECDAFDRLPSALWVLISGISNDNDAYLPPQQKVGEPFSLKKDIHVNVVSHATQQRLSVFALQLPTGAKNVSWNQNTFTALFREMTDHFIRIYE